MKRNTKGTFLVSCFRLSSFFASNKLLKLIGFPIRILYKIFIEWFIGMEIPDETRIGRNFTVYHGLGIVINKDAIIGNNVVIRQNTTIGNAKENGGSPKIEDNVQIGANSVIIGEIRIGRNSIIGAGSVVVHDVEDFVIVAGNPARIIKYSHNKIDQV